MWSEVSNLRRGRPAGTGLARVRDTAPPQHPHSKQAAQLTNLALHDIQLLGACLGMAHTRTKNEEFMSANGYRFYSKCPNNCPPLDAKPVDGEIFRGLRSSKLCPDEFKSFHELGREKDSDDQCMACGLSVWVGEAEYRHARGLLPWVRRWGVAKARLKPQHGMIKKNGTDGRPHNTLWPDVSHDLCKIFKLVDTSAFQK